MNTYEPKLKLYCFYQDGNEKYLTLDIDLSYDPLLAKPYTKEWILDIIDKNFKCEKQVQYIHIYQENMNYCREDLPYWYYELNRTLK